MMTDFGIEDGNVGVMKGVIWAICPEANIADVSHMIGAQNVREAALILARSAPFFPAGTVQLVVVDPGVGTARRPMAARIGDKFYVGPDNGALTLWLEQARSQGSAVEFVHLDRPTYWLTEVSHVFHGRDIFAPVAAHLARGVPLRDVGSPLENPVLLDLPRPVRLRDGWEGEVIHIDHFGNASSNIRVEDLTEALRQKERTVVRLGKYEIRGLVDTFGEREPGDTVALIGSTGNLIVSVVNGDAAACIDVHVGDPLSVTLLGSGESSGDRAK